MESWEWQRSDMSSLSALDVSRNWTLVLRNYQRQRERWVPAAPSMQLTLQRIELHQDSTCARDSLCALQLALGTAGTV